MGTYTYPPFPTTGQGLSAFLISLVEWVIEVPLIAIANIITGIGGSATTAGETSTTSVIGFIGQTWNQSIASFAQFGVLAPLIASLIWGLSIIVLIFFAFKAIQLATREIEEE